jgi:hypothetical protein
MKLKALCAAVLATTALLAFVSTASATTLEVKGVKQTGSVAIEATIAAGGSTLLTDTLNNFGNTSKASVLKWETQTPFTVAGTGAIGGPVTFLEWSGSVEGNPVVDAKGSLSFEWLKGTTNATVRSNSTKVTWPSFFGPLTCTTSNTPIGTLKGVAAGNATIEINSVLTCTVIGTAKWSGTYTVTSPAGLGVIE